MNSTIRYFKRNKLVFIFFLLDLLLLFLHLSLSYKSSFFHLDFEHNLPTIYQSTKLILAGTLSALVLWQLWIMDKINRSSVIFFGLFAVGYIFLGLDEIGQLHEHIDFFVREFGVKHADSQLLLAESLGYRSSTWMLYYIPIFLAAIVYFIYAAKFVWKRIPQVKIPFMSMIIFFAATVYLEFISNQDQILPSVYYAYITFEETAEMLGATSGLAVVLKPFLDNSKLIRERVRRNV